MGEPLNFVAGGGRLFKNYLRELRMIFCAAEGGGRLGGGVGGHWVVGGRLPTPDDVSSWALASTQIT